MGTARNAYRGLAYEVQNQTPSSSVPIQCQNELSFIALPNLSASISLSIKTYINSSTLVKKYTFTFLCLVLGL